MYEVSIVPILVAGIIATAIGFVWYHPKVFGNAWMRLAGITPESVERGKKKMPVVVLVATLAAMLVAYVMNHFGIAWGVFDVVGAIELGIWTWVGFVAPVMLGIVLWEQKSFKLYAINASYWLVTLVVMSVILVLLG